MKKLKPQQAALASGTYCTLGSLRPNGEKAKRGWPTKSEAKRTMKAINAQSGAKQHHRRLTGVYECRCGLWHHTSC